MAPARSLLLLLLVAGLAGCTDNAPPPETSPDQDPTLVTAPDDYTYLEGSNNTGEHLHDYWGGGDRLVVLEATEHLGATGGGSVFKTFRPDQDQVVPQGTATVEITFAWTEETGSFYEDSLLWVQRGDQQDRTEIGPISNGETVAVSSDNDANDLPHARLSGWTFAVQMTAGPTGYARFDGEVTVVVEALRGLEIPLYPGHPDRWQGADALPLLEHSSTTVFSQLGGALACVMSCQNTFRVDQGVVPHDASFVEVLLTSGPGTPLKLGLLYHGADTWAWEPLTPESTQGDQKRYVIPLAGNGDGPYAPKSLWDFQIISQDPMDEGLYGGDFHLVATAHRQPA